MTFCNLLIYKTLQKNESEIALQQGLKVFLLHAMIYITYIFKIYKGGMKMDETSSLLLRMPKPLREEFKRITKKIGSNETATINILIAEYIAKMNKLEEEGLLPIFEGAEVSKKPKRKIKKPSSKKKGTE